MFQTVPQMPLIKCQILKAQRELIHPVVSSLSLLGENKFLLYRIKEHIL